MHATKSLPADYEHLRTFDLKRDLSLLVRLNIAGLLLFLPIGWLFLSLGALLNPQAGSVSSIISPSTSSLFQLLAYLCAAIFAIILHEIVHGLFFLIVTRTLPKFGFQGAYAFAAAPDWYINRNHYLWIGIAPLIVISLGGIILIPMLPNWILHAWLFMLIINATGAVGDVYVVSWLIRGPKKLLIQDLGDVITVYSMRSD
jgi:hypothetical protein